MDNSMAHHLHKRLLNENSSSNAHSATTSNGEDSSSSVPPPPYTFSMPRGHNASHSDLLQTIPCNKVNRITIDATTTVSGTANVVAIDAAVIGARVAACLAQVFKQNDRSTADDSVRQQEDCSDDEYENDTDEEKSVDLRLFCGVRVVGARNVVGPGAAFGGVRPGADVGLKRKANEEASSGADVPEGKRSKNGV